MGLDYEIHLYFPQEQIWNVLQSLAAIAKPVGETTIVLPDRQIVLPFTRRFKSETIHFNDDTLRLKFDTSLYFDSDEAIEKYMEEDTLADEIKNQRRDGKGRVSIGYIYVNACIGVTRFDPDKKYCFVDLLAATSAMSLLFEQSQSIKGTMERLLKQHEGVCGAFVDGDALSFFSYFWPPGIATAEDVEKLFTSK